MSQSTLQGANCSTPGFVELVWRNLFVTLKGGHRTFPPNVLSLTLLWCLDFGDWRFRLAIATHSARAGFPLCTRRRPQQGTLLSADTPLVRGLTRSTRLSQSTP